jgi:hypothetical protein
MGQATRCDKVEWHPGELYPRVGFIVTNMTRPAKRVVAFYNQRGTAEQWDQVRPHAVAWTRLSWPRLAANAVRLPLHALAYTLANFLRTLALHAEVSQWSMTTLRERLVKIGARIVRHGRSIIFQMGEVIVPGELFAQILAAIATLRPTRLARCRAMAPCPGQSAVRGKTCASMPVCAPNGLPTWLPNERAAASH